MGKYTCNICGYIYEGSAAPTNCSQCGGNNWITTGTGTVTFKEYTDNFTMTFDCYSLGDFISDDGLEICVGNKNSVTGEIVGNFNMSAISCVTVPNASSWMNAYIDSGSLIGDTTNTAGLIHIDVAENNTGSVRTCKVYLKNADGNKTTNYVEVILTFKLPYEMWLQIPLGLTAWASNIAILFTAFYEHNKSSASFHQSLSHDNYTITESSWNSKTFDGRPVLLVHPNCANFTYNAIRPSVSAVNNANGNLLPNLHVCIKFNVNNDSIDTPDLSNSFINLGGIQKQASNDNVVCPNAIIDYNSLDSLNGGWKTEIQQANGQIALFAWICNISGSTLTVGKNVYGACYSTYIMTSSGPKTSSSLNPIKMLTFTISSLNFSIYM